MFHKFKISTCVFILCLFGLTLITVSPVFAHWSSATFVECQKIKGKTNKEAKIKCFADLAQSILPLGDNTGRHDACANGRKWKNKRVKCFRNLARTLQDEDDERAQAKALQVQSDAAEAKLWDGTKRDTKNGGDFYAADVEAGPTWKNEKGVTCRMVNRRTPGSGNGEKTNAIIHSNWFTLAKECDEDLSAFSQDQQRALREMEMRGGIFGR